MKLEIHALTHPGGCPVNEDAVMVDGTVLSGRTRRIYSSILPDDGLLVAVADGVSGTPCVARASRRALEELALEQTRRRELRPYVLRTVQAKLAEAEANSPCFGMSCCIAALFFGGSHVSLIHAGDCRIYLGRNGKLKALTADHSAGAAMVRRGDAPASFAEDGLASIYRALESSVIADANEADFEIGWTTMDAAPGDLWLLTTDGVHGAFAALEEADLLYQLMTSQNIRSRIEAISRMHAASYAMTVDNSSLIAVYLSE